MNDKQQKILQMAKDICRVKLNCNDVCNPISACDALKYAERAVEAGYSKQSEGEWIYGKTNYRSWFCSKCGYPKPYRKIKAGYHVLDDASFCPNCGAKMKGESDVHI